MGKLSRQNPALANRDPRETLRDGIVINYKSPEVGDIYIVQSGDWLVRIAEWKYGEMDYWKEVFRKNSAHIKNPDLIHPGDEISLNIDGTIENAKTHEVLVQGMIQDERVRSLASKIKDSPIWGWTGIYSPYFLSGFLAGLLLLLITPAIWFFQRMRRPFRADPGFGTEGKAPKRPDPKPPVKRVEKEDSEDNVVWGKFKKRPSDYEDLMKRDRSWFQGEGGDPDRVPGYFSLSKKTRKKYMKRKAK